MALPKEGPQKVVESGSSPQRREIVVRQQERLGIEGRGEVGHGYTVPWWARPKGDLRSYELMSEEEYKRRFGSNE